MRFERVCDDDLPLIRRMLSDPAMMRHLGGVLSEEQIVASHQKQLASATAGGWCFKVLPEADNSCVSGTVMIWPSTWRDQPIYEMGWMTLPEHQGQGITSRAVCRILKQAARENTFEEVHAFPAVGNTASNRVCEKVGFVLRGTCDIFYKDRPLTCHHWVWTAP